MIRFHYHRAVRAVPHLGIARGALLCHVFSDLPDVRAATEELEDWGRKYGPAGLRIQHRGQRRQHFDLWGTWLRHCGEPADRAIVRAWLRGEAPPVSQSDGKAT